MSSHLQWPPKLTRTGNNTEDQVLDAVTRISQSYVCYFKKFSQSSRAYGILQRLGLITVLGLLKTPNTTRKTVLVSLKQLLSDLEEEEEEAMVAECINMAMRLFFMISTGPYHSPGFSFTVTGETQFHWTDETVEDLLGTSFGPTISMNETVKLEKIFNARNLERIGGLEIRWTSNLADHLRLRDDDTAVELFHYVSFLRDTELLGASVYRQGFIEETLRTLALLLPEHDEATKTWFEKQQSRSERRGRLPLDPLARECGQLKVTERQIDKFVYWHDRLVMLKQVFDEAEPRNIKQWWNDRRKRVQWYTFWVAALVLGLTIFFGLVQSIEGALQVQLAYKQGAGDASS